MAFFFMPLLLTFKIPMAYYRCKVREREKKMAKYVYVVNGSEDGVLGVYTTLKRAWERLSKYVIDAEGGNRKLDISYKNFRRYFISGSSCMVSAEESNFASATVTAFITNGD